MTTPQRNNDRNMTDRGLHITPPAARVSDVPNPLCDSAPDREQCEAFLDRLSEASNNIDRRA